MNSTTTEPRPDNIIRLRDGRILAYAEYGDPHGLPVMLFHGHPGSRLEGQLTHAAALRHGVRIIVPDRPGYGLSDFKPNRAIADWPDDVLDLAGALGLGRFAVGGISGGGPYAAVCALRIPERLTAVAILSGVGPIDAPGATEGMMRTSAIGFALTRRAPILSRLMLGAMAWAARRDPEGTMGRLERSMPEPDARILQDPGVRAAFEADLLEAFHQGARGAAHDFVLYSKPWGFRLQDIAMEVDLWQGEQDRNVPPAMGRYQAGLIPNCNARFVPGEGHLLALSHADEIMQTMVRKSKAS